MLEGEGVPQGLTEAIADFYTWVLDTDRPGPVLSSDLHLALKPYETDQQSIDVQGRVGVAEVLDAHLAVMFDDAFGDIVLAVDGGTGWRVVGAKLQRLERPAIYGRSPRLLLMIGSDARPGQNPLIFRGDSLHILALRPDVAEGAIVGIPRDTLITMPDGSLDKITHSMASRGPEVLMATAEDLTGLDFEGYIVTGFSGFAGAVNALGGFIFSLPFSIEDPKAQADLKAGTQHFNGDEALAYARVRSLAGGDIRRQYNQGNLLLAMLAEASGTDPTEIPRLLAIFTRFVSTDLSPSELLTLAMAVFELDPGELPNVVVTGSIERAAGRSVVVLNDEAAVIFEDVADGTLEADYPYEP